MRAVNLIPAEQREGAGSLTGRSEGAALILLGLVAGLALLAVLYGSARHSESKDRAELSTINAEASVVRAEIGKLAPYTSFIAMANQRVQTVSQLVGARFDWSHSFNELGRVLPRQTTLTSLHGQVGGSGPGSSAGSTPAAAGATPTSATPPGSMPTFTISGCATSQSEVAQTLQRLRLIDGVTDVTLQSSVKAAPAGSSAGSGGSSGSGAGGGACGPGTATFAATIAFTGLPTPPATNPPAAGANSTVSSSRAGAGSPTPASNQTGASR